MHTVLRPLYKDNTRHSVTCLGDPTQQNKPVTSETTMWKSGTRSLLLVLAVFSIGQAQDDYAKAEVRGVIKEIRKTVAALKEGIQLIDLTSDINDIITAVNGSLSLLSANENGANDVVTYVSKENDFEDLPLPATRFDGMIFRLLKLQKTLEELDEKDTSTPQQLYQTLLSIKVTALDTLALIKAIYASSDESTIVTFDPTPTRRGMDATEKEKQFLPKKAPSLEEEPRALPPSLHFFCYMSLHLHTIQQHAPSQSDTHIKTNQTLPESEVSRLSSRSNEMNVSPEDD
ncbi:unnamed protein product [Lymnaea stagnalis]|uniref:Uncharacterized protein n=1 Tax=Lymnaea stagnalis TaxID=6523 RepID=A0AAV2HBZ0_LYMST